MARNYAVESISSLPFGMLIGAPLSAAIEAQTQAAKATIDFILQVGFLPPNTAAANLSDPDPVDVTKPDALPAGTNDPTTNAGKTRMVTFTYSASNEDPQLVAIAMAAADAAAQESNATLAATAAKDSAGVTDVMKAAIEAAEAEIDATAATVAAVILPSTNQTAKITVPILSVVPIPYFSIDEMTIDFVAKINEVVTASSRASARAVKSASAHAKAGWGPVFGSIKAGMSSTHSSTSARSSKYQTELTMTIHVRATSESMPKGMEKVLDMLAGIIKSERA